MFINFIRKIINFFKEKEAFICDSEHCIEIVEGNHFKGYIYYRSPTSQELLDYAHIALEYSQSELSDLAQKTVPEFDFKALHLTLLREKTIPFAKKIITKWENYTFKNGDNVTKIDDLIKHFTTHIEYVVEQAFEQKTTFKKKY